MHAGVGKPTDLRHSNFQCSRISMSQVPTAQEAVQAYEEQGGRLTMFPQFGTDPLANDSVNQAERERLFHASADVEQAYGELVSGQHALFRQAFVTYEDINRILSGTQE